MINSIKIRLVWSIFLVTCTSLSAASFELIPHFGASIPNGSQAETWKIGYTVGLDVFKSSDNPLQWGAIASLHRLTPDADEMLRVGSRELLVETSEGWNALFHLFAVARYMETKDVWIDGGLGVVYRRTSDVKVKGVYGYGPTAINHEINRTGKGELVPAFTVGLSAKLAGVVQPTFRFHRAFTTDGGTNLFSIELGLLAR